MFKNSFFFFSKFYTSILNNFFRSFRLCVRIVNLILPANNAKLVPPLGPLLGQFSVNGNEFCNQFNVLSKEFDRDFPVRVGLALLGDRKFRVELKQVRVRDLIVFYSVFDFKKNKYVISRLSLYKVFYFYFYFSNLTKISVLRSVLGVIRSFGNFYIF